MSFGDPNNPYGAQQQPQQPGYGYPQAPAPGPYGAPGYAAQAMPMPSSVKTGRIMVWVIVALQAIFSVYALATLGEVDKAVEEASRGTTGVGSDEVELAASIGKGVVIMFVVFAVIFAILGLIIALKYVNGTNTVRTCAIVWAAFAIVGGLFQMPIGIATIVLAILLIVFAAKGDSKAWFNRPRA
ncbi:hypothetical protein I3F58_06910 [Streptomyces sp. MUM 203J]|uniref:hypothetical protein n=1 Tax=Streptomyces sp. MUM 203J TaxID=2791990 RepID=UPI001F03BB3C|nr:hypothetical protein [Streptomyces sp. MUM 203J]MCH0539293.1 hypothetical protein [Streptomyces sp. MUM 203J]